MDMEMDIAKTFDDTTLRLFPKEGWIILARFPGVGHCGDGKIFALTTAQAINFAEVLQLAKTKAEANDPKTEIYRIPCETTVLTVETIEQMMAGDLTLDQHIVNEISEDQIEVELILGDNDGSIPAYVDVLALGESFYAEANSHESADEFAKQILMSVG